MRALLVRPENIHTHIHQQGVKKRLGDQHQPLGLLYLAAMLEKEGLEVRICDELVGDSIQSMCSQFNPTLMGITLTTPLRSRAKEIISWVKKEKQDCKVVIGGPHPSALPQQTLVDTGADAVIVGEGENTLVELCQSDNWAQIKGLLFKKNGEIVTNPPREPIRLLDHLPFPARHLLDFQKYKKDIEFGFLPRKSSPLMRLLSSRGCPYKCSFCSSHKIFGRKVRFRSPGNVLEEIIRLRKDFGAHNFMFMDDTFPIDEERARDICQLIIKRDLNIHWGCFARVGLSLETLQMMKQAGCKLIGFGVESGSPEVLRRIKKGIGPTKVIETFERCRKVGITTKAFFMVGLPQEGEKEFRESLRLAKKINPLYLWVSIYLPLPGTELYEEIATCPGKCQVNMDSYFNSQNRQLRERHRRFIRSFYLRWGYLITFVKNLSPEGIRYAFHMLRAFLFLK